MLPVEFKKMPCCPVEFKEKLAHNSMSSHLVFLSCLLGVVKAFVEENNRNINIICAHRERKILFWDS